MKMLIPKELLNNLKNGQFVKLIRRRVRSYHSCLVIREVTPICWCHGNEDTMPKYMMAAFFSRY